MALHLSGAFWAFQISEYAFLSAVPAEVAVAVLAYKHGSFADVFVFYEV